MQHSAAVSVLDSTRHFCHQFYAVPRSITHRSKVLVQTSLLRELHAEKRQTVLTFTHFVNREDIRVIQTGHRLCFSSETLQRPMRISAITEDALYRDDASGMSLPGAINHAHAAATDLFENFVISQK